MNRANGKFGLLTIKALVILFLIGSLTSCKKNEVIIDDEEIALDKYGVPLTQVNTWIRDNMRQIYYWNNQIPGNSSLDMSKQPEEFFESLLFREDRFSWIQDAEELGDNLSGVSTTVGLGIQLISLADRSVIISVRYALPGSPAALAGIKRGDIISAINGSSMTLDNYSSVMQPYYSGNPFRVQLAKLNGDLISNDKEIQLTPVQNFQEMAIQKDTVLTTPSGKKVAYLFYNRFLNNQINELLGAFSRFKEANVDELVLDMRYNSGGGIFISGVLTSMIYNNYNENDVFVKYLYNSNYRDEEYSFYRLFGGTSSNASEKQNADLIVTLTKGFNLGLNRVFILATGSSASATELVINNLKPFMSASNVVHIGRTTVGKNQGSTTIKDESKAIKWGLQPIIVLLANKNGEGDYVNGLIPMHDINENNFLPYKPLGDISDPLLNKAMVTIDPAIQAITQSKLMQIGRQKGPLMLIEEVRNFEDLNNLPRPVDVGETYKN